jgi:hypothetical protein
MNSVNFVDPFGEAIINVFLAFNGYGKIDRRAFQAIGSGFPNWDALRILAKENKHTLNVYRLGDKDFTIENLRKSLNAVTLESPKDVVWTFVIGHSTYLKGSENDINRRNAKYDGIHFSKNLGYFGASNTEIVPDITTNEYVGFFSCNSSSYANNIVTGIATFFSLNGHGTTSLMANIEKAAYAVILSLINGATPKDAAEQGTKVLHELGNVQRARDQKSPRDLEDSVQVTEAF